MLGLQPSKVEERAFMPVFQEKIRDFSPVDFRYLNEDSEIRQIWLTAGTLSTHPAKHRHPRTRIHHPVRLPVGPAIQQLLPQPRIQQLFARHCFYPLS